MSTGIFESVPPIARTEGFTMGTVPTRSTDESIPPIARTGGFTMETVDESIPPIARTGGYTMETTVDESIPPIARTGGYTMETVDESIPPIARTGGYTMETVDESIPPIARTGGCTMDTFNMKSIDADVGGSESTSTSSRIEVDHELNPTELYQKICEPDWKGALVALEKNPLECRTWVVKRDPCRNDDNESVRFLPLHSACARKPPLEVIVALLTTYPEGVSIVDDNGMLPLHYACANQASAEVVELLLARNQEANRFRVQLNGSLPVHLAAQWGVSSPTVMDVLLVGNYDLACALDNEELTPLDLAMIAEEYSGKRKVVEILRNAFKMEVMNTDRDDSTISTHFSEKRNGLESFIFVSNSEDGKNSPLYKSEDRKNIPLHKSKDRKNSPLYKQSLNGAEQMMAELNDIREEINGLKSAYTLHQEGTRDQLEREWEAVKLTIREMKRQTSDRNKDSQYTKSSRGANSNRISHKRRELRTIERAVSKMGSSNWLSLSQTNRSRSRSHKKSTYESRDDGDRESGSWDGKKERSRTDSLTDLFISSGRKRKTPRLEEILQENKSMEAELRRLKTKSHAYELRIKQTEEIIAEISTSVSLMMKKNKESKRSPSRKESNRTPNSRPRPRRTRQDILKYMLKSDD